MDMSEYQPDGRCGTCRHVRHVSGGGFHEPPFCEQECGVEDQLVQIRDILLEVADECGDEDAYGADPIEGCGDARPCPLYLPVGTCEEHGLPELGEFGCRGCDEEAARAEAEAMREDEEKAAEWRRENGL